MSALSTIIQELRNISIYDKPPDNAEEENDIFFTMGVFEDFVIRFAEEKLNDSSPKFSYESKQFGKSFVLSACVGMIYF